MKSFVFIRSRDSHDVLKFIKSCPKRTLHHRILVCSTSPIFFSFFFVRIKENIYCFPSAFNGITQKLSPSKGWQITWNRVRHASKSLPSNQRLRHYHTICLSIMSLIFTKFYKRERKSSTTFSLSEKSFSSEKFWFFYLERDEAVIWNINPINILFTIQFFTTFIKIQWVFGI